MDIERQTKTLHNFAKELKYNYCDKQGNWYDPAKRELYKSIMQTTILLCVEQQKELALIRQTEWERKIGLTA
jgi:hypothetical protein